MSKRTRQIVANPAAAAAEIIPMVTDVVKNVGGLAQDAANKAESVAGADKQPKPGDNDFLNDLNVTQQSAREQLIGYGLDSEAYQKYEDELMQAGFPSRLTASKFIQDIAAIAGSSASTIQEVFPIGLAIYRRNIKSPERAIAILRTIAKYEGQMPGLGLFNLAYQAATGNFNPQALSLVRMGLLGLPGTKGNMNATRDLQQAFDGINAPNSPLGSYLNQTNLVEQRMQATREQLLMQAKLIELQFATARNQKLSEIYAFLSANLPTWVKNNDYFLRDAYNALSTITYLSSLKDTAMKGLSIGGNSGLNDAGTPQTGFINPKGASAERVRKVVAQNKGAEPQVLPSTPAPTPSSGLNPQQPQQEMTQEQQVNQNINQTNAGQSNDIYKLALQEGVITTQRANDLQKLESLIQVNRAALETNYNNLVDMMSAGQQPQSMFAQGMSVAPYVTPEQIEYYASTANGHATTLIQLIGSMLTIFVEMTQAISVKQVSAQGGGIYHLSALLRNAEAQYRQQLKEVQQKRLQIFDISVLGPIDQEIRTLEPKYKQMETGVEMMNAFNNVGADFYVMPFAQIAMQMSDLYGKAATAYRSAINKLKEEPAMVQYCNARAEQMEAAAQQAMSKGMIALRNLMKQQSGGVIAEREKKIIKLGEDSSKKDDDIVVENDTDDVVDVEAKPMEVDEYWDELYHNDPPYGDVMVHPEKHRKEPSWKMRSKHKITRLN